MMFHYQCAYRELAKDIKLWEAFRHDLNTFAKLFLCIQLSLCGCGQLFIFCRQLKFMFYRKDYTFCRFSMFLAADFSNWTSGEDKELLDLVVDFDWSADGEHRDWKKIADAMSTNKNRFEKRKHLSYN